MFQVKSQESQQGARNNTFQNKNSRELDRILGQQKHGKRKEAAQKHKKNLKKSDKVYRNKQLQQQQNQIEDQIYAFMGELGQRNQENSMKEDLALCEDIQRESIQTNYSFNKVVRTPYEYQINVLEHLQQLKLLYAPHTEFIGKLIKQMQILHKKLEQQRQIWEFRDPMGPEEQSKDQFSLMEINKLISNYIKRNIVLNYPHLSIFLLWIGKICKAPAWKDFFVILSSYVIEYQSFDRSQNKCQNWDRFHKYYQQKQIHPSVLASMNVCDQKTIKAFVSLYCQWVKLFQLVSFC